MVRALAQLRRSAIAIAAGSALFGVAVAQPDPDPPPPAPLSSGGMAFAPNMEWEKRQNVDDRLRAYGPDLLGDQIDPHTGGISFEHTDVSLPGNSGLDVSVRRRRSQGSPFRVSSSGGGGGASVNVRFGDWELVVPQIEVVTKDGWTGNRCSAPFSTTIPTEYTVYKGVNNFQITATVQSHEYSLGVNLAVPGAGSQQVLESDGDPQWPAGATHVTTEGWYLYCDSVAATDGGETFVARAPDGRTFYFRRQLQFMHDSMGAYATGKQQGMLRLKTILAATEVTDASGNWVRYHYTGSRLTQIEANDGRVIDLAYENASFPELISRVTANGRNWTYVYRANTATLPVWEVAGGSAYGNQVLATVTQPDGRAWVFGLDDMTMEPSSGDTPDCQGNFIFNITHPYGMSGQFEVYEQEHRLGHLTVVPKGPGCPLGPDEAGGIFDPPQYRIATAKIFSVVRKTLSGPGVSNATWTFDYENDPGTFAEGDHTNWTTVTEPGNTQIKYLHRWKTEAVAGGSLIRTERWNNGAGAAVETVVNDYSVEDWIGQSFAYFTGMESPSLLKPTRMTQIVTTRDGDSFTTLNEYNSTFSSPSYSYGFPTRVTEHVGGSQSGLSRVTDTVYAHNETKWVLGLPSTVTRNTKLFDSYAYDASGRVLTHSKFGGIYKTYTYHTSGAQAGLVHTATDANNHIYTLTGWKRGQVQNILRPGGTTFSRVVDNNGWVTSETDAKGQVTTFSHGDMGWLEEVNYPGSYFASLSVGYAGLGTGVQETRTRGNKRTVISYDGMLRPTLVKSESLGGEFTPFYEKMSYDIFGRETFKSWPSTSASPTAGVDTTFDALSRPLTVRETVFLNALTTTRYDSGGLTEVTDPALAVVNTYSRAFGSPQNPEVMQVFDAMGAETEIVRDIHGNILTLTQSGSQNGFNNVSAERRFWYDADLRLCRHRAPEFNDEVFVYDAEDRLIASGRGVAAAETCPAVATDIAQNVRVVRGYDVLDRETSVNFPGTAPDINRTYDANSNVIDVLRGNVWSYDYNELDQITGETLNIDGGTYTFVYDYGTDGALRGRDNMHSAAMWRFDPDALGRPQSARIDATSYVGSVDYHPNGLIADAAYLNGYSLDQTLNTRQLPDALKTTKSGQPNAVWLSYTYDARRKIASVSDLDGQGANEGRTYGYDANGRLVSALGPWGSGGAQVSGSFKYDALGNLREQALGTRLITVNYQASKNRVTSAVEGSTTRNYSYDVRGNTTRIAIGGVNRDFTYDHSNQPTAVSGSATATYVYDGNLKRVKEVRGGKTIYNIFSKVTGGLIYRFDDATGTANDIRTDYVNVGGAALRLKKTGTGAPVPEYTHFDSQGSAVAATNAAGTITWRERYAPFGEELLNPPLNADNTAYTGHLKDDATGLNYMQARYYDPIIGRFLSTDPIGYQDQLNLYAYVYNDPVNVTDPTGECPWCIGAVIGAVAKIVEIKASGGTVLSKEGALQVAGAAALGAVGGQVGAVVSGGLKAAGAIAAAKSGLQAGKIATAVGTTTADAAGGAAGNVASEVVSQAATPGPADGAAIRDAAVAGAVGGAFSSAAAQTVEGVAKSSTIFSDSAASAAGSVTSAVVDTAVAVKDALAAPTSPACMPEQC